MAYGQQADMTDLSSTSQPGPAGADLDLAHHLGQVSLIDSSPVLTTRTPKYTRKFSLRELEIQQTIGKTTISGVLARRFNTVHEEVVWTVGSARLYTYRLCMVYSVPEKSIKNSFTVVVYCCLKKAAY